MKRIRNADTTSLCDALDLRCRIRKEGCPIKLTCFPAAAGECLLCALCGAHDEHPTAMAHGERDEQRRYTAIGWAWLWWHACARRYDLEHVTRGSEVVSRRERGEER